MMLSVFFFNDTATTEIYTLSLHDALPICDLRLRPAPGTGCATAIGNTKKKVAPIAVADRKSTRLNSSHSQISYAVFCLKKKKIIKTTHHIIDSCTRCTPITSSCAS